jgi:hypothetical protein
MTAREIRLPADMLDRLRTAGGSAGIAEEIRRRLEASFAADASGPKGRALIAQISRVAGHSLISDAWRDDPHAFAAVREAVLWVLAGFEPSGDPATSPHAKKIHELFGSKIGAKALGRMLAMQTREPAPAWKASEDDSSEKRGST